ncbi:MAG TPA: helix-turn-helix transcriptional regulator [bacterium]|nr:helix-turn-helix transcriptional regulator [bacterium]
MDGLRARELRAVLAFLQELYATCDLKEFQAHVVSVLPQLVPADSISYNEVNPQARRNQYVSVPVVPPQYEPAFLRHIGEHPLITHYHRTRDGRALRVADFLSQRQFHRLALYNEFFRPLRLEYQVAVTLPVPPPLVLGIALSRNRRDFTDRETQLLNLLRPHFVQAYRNAELVTRMRQEQASVAQMLDELPYGLVVLSRDGRVRLANARAVRTLTAVCGWRRKPPDRLPDELERWVHHSVAATRTPRPASLVVGREGLKLIARLVHTPSERLLLLEEQTGELTPHSLLPLGLTHREADVLACVAQGKTNIEIATILSISPRTAQKHLEHVYDKLGIRRRAGAVMLAQVHRLQDSVPGK